MIKSKRIIGFDNYLIHSSGIVENTKTGRLIYGSLDSYGYVRTNLSKHGKPKSVLIHRIIAIHFIDGYSDGLEVNHKNGIKVDNRIDNLEWVTGRENKRHAYKIGLHKSRSKYPPNKKLTQDDVVIIKERLKRKEFQKDIALDYSVSPAAISLIARGISWV